MILTVILTLAACSTPNATPAPTPVVAAPPVAAAPPEHAHAGEHAHGAPHGGVVQALGDIHVEALMMPAGVMFYLSDREQQPLAVDGYSGSAVVNGPTGVTMAALMSMGDHLHAAAPLAQGKPASVVLTLTHDGKGTGASWETKTVGLQSHDHTALHGGQVSMWGHYHLEYAPKDGEHRAWVTDEHRNPVAGPVTGSVKDGATTLALSQDASGMLSVKGEGAGSRPVIIDVVVGDVRFSLPFTAVGTGAAASGAAHPH